MCVKSKSMTKLSVPHVYLNGKPFCFINQQKYLHITIFISFIYVSHYRICFQKSTMEFSPEFAIFQSSLQLANQVRTLFNTSII